MRNNLNLTYKKTFGKKEKPIDFTYSFSGNAGGYNSEADPDAFKNTYTKVSDNVLRNSVRLNWLVNSIWITNVEFSASMNYSDKKQTIKTNKSASSTQSAIHTTEEGYFIATEYDKNPNANILLLPTGYWYETSYDDDKPVYYTAEIKGKWSRDFGILRSNFLLGSQFNSSGNYGKGVSYEDMRYAPTYREFRYDEQPFINNISLYAEEKLTFPLFKRELQLQGGVRYDVISINGSEYGTVSSLSPRSNMKYTFIDKGNGFVKNVSIHAGLGDAVKLPSSYILYPRPSYTDKISFASTTSGDGTAFYAYYTLPAKPIYNADLKWQRNRKAEIGIDLNLGGTKISLTAFRDKIYNPYKSAASYVPFSYKLTSQSALNDCLIPEQNRVFSIDQSSGIVTVSDKTGQLASQQLTSKTQNTF
ncbi:MAG: TonB-dependent receptor [Paludibacteraceae bacterium]